jgi:hypothetical protein
MGVSGDIGIIIKINEIAAQRGEKRPEHQPEQ